MFKFLSKIVIKLSGWKYESKIDASISHGVAIFAPHTSNWDFFFSILILRSIGFPLKILMKDSFFIFPLSILLKSMGVVPIDRKKNTNFVQSTAEIMKSYDSFYIGIAPEGTRSKVDKWKTGFYYLALEANVPIIMGYLDYKNKFGLIGNLLYPTGNIEEDFKIIKEFYKNSNAKYPEKWNLEGITNS